MTDGAAGEAVTQISLAPEYFEGDAPKIDDIWVVLLTCPADVQVVAPSGWTSSPVAGAPQVGMWWYRLPTNCPPTPVFTLSRSCRVRGSAWACREGSDD